MYYHYSAATDAGSREENQDNLCCCSLAPYYPEYAYDLSFRGEGHTDAFQIFAVFDGVSSTENAAFAARFCAEFFALRAKVLTAETGIKAWMGSCFDEVDEKLTIYHAERQKLASCTAAVLLLHERRYFFANIGDSPAFLLRKGEAVLPLAELHNRAAQKRRENEAKNVFPGDPGYQNITPQDHCRLRYYLGNCSRYPSEVIHFTEGEMMSHDTFIVCTDGITNRFLLDKLLKESVRGREAEYFVSKSATLREADNCTCIRVDVL